MIINTNNIEWLKKQPDNSIDHIISDPPYLINFMGKGWDSEDNIAGNPEFWKECLRVVKPGGYCLAFGHSRTHHRVMSAIEDAGWEIRDCLMWLTGQGFPKSQDLGKNIAKKRGEELKVLGKNPNHREPDALYKLGFQGGRGDGLLTKADNEWSGWGSALKPAYEPIIMARKPFKGSLVNNVLEWNTGALNIDACRVGATDKAKFPTGEYSTDTTVGKIRSTNRTEDSDPQGRFPANIILDEEAGKLLDEQAPKTGQLAATTGKEPSASKKNKIYNDYSMVEGKPSKPKDGLSGASRFFYCAKVSTKERNLGCEDLESQKVNDGRKAEIDNPYQRGETFRKNTHPTVKPIALMEWLIKLVSKEGQTILDPFMGSGSTGCAAQKLNRNFIGLELNKEYCEIAEKRIKYFEDNKE